MSQAEIVTIVSHDAGGAEILASYLAMHNFEYRLVLQGPAIDVFRRKFGGVEILGLVDGLEQADWCLCGTGWQSDLEWQAIGLARNMGKHVVAFLDHWTNYKGRFTRAGKQHLPDEIWLGDEYALAIATGEFPATSLRLVENPYFLDIKHQLKNIDLHGRRKRSNDNVLLFLSENISDHARHKHNDERYWGYTEFDAIEYLIAHIDSLEMQVDRVIIRPHPSDTPGKYDQLAGLPDISIGISKDTSLLEDIAASDIVAGCESVAMVTALQADKKVVSCIPPGGPLCCLPHRDILSLRDLVNSK